MLKDWACKYDHKKEAKTRQTPNNNGKVRNGEKEGWRKTLSAHAQAVSEPINTVFNQYGWRGGLSER